MHENKLTRKKKKRKKLNEKKDQREDMTEVFHVEKMYIRKRGFGAGKIILTLRRKN